MLFGLTEISGTIEERNFLYRLMSGVERHVPFGFEAYLLVRLGFRMNLQAYLVSE
jgi:hypothetical protein